MNPDAANPTPKDDEQNAAGTPPVTGTPEAPASPSPDTTGLSPEPTGQSPAAPDSPESPVVPPATPTDTPAPVTDTPSGTEQAPAVAPAPHGASAAPTMSKKLIVVAGLGVLVLAVLAALLTLL